MAYRNRDYSDLSLFGNRLLKLMQHRQINAAKQLAKELYEAGLVKVKQRDNFGGKAANLGNAIGSVEKKIQDHLKSKSADRLQGEFVLAYCQFFGCSADYLFGRTDIESGNIDVRRICILTGLSEKAVNRLIEERPDYMKKDLAQFWSEMLEAPVFYGFPLEWDQMCKEFSLYQAAEKQIERVNKASEMFHDEDTDTETLRQMMEANYQKEAKPHLGAFYLHLTNFNAYMTTFLERSAEAYAARNKQDVEIHASMRMRQRFETSHNEFLRRMEEAEE